MTTDKERKQSPLYSGVLRYFPDALVQVAQCSFIANEQHNPGQKMFWNRAKSPDELDSLTRHLIHAGEIDTDGIRHSAKVAWRALANLQKELENADTSEKYVVRQPVMDEEDLVSLGRDFANRYFTETPHAVGLGDIEQAVDAAKAERKTTHPLHTK